MVGQRGQGEFGWGGVSFSVQYGQEGDSGSASVFKEGGVKGGGIPRACSMFNQSTYSILLLVSVLNSCDDYT